MRTFFSWLKTERGKVFLLLASAFLMLGMMLGLREIWTQEWRWADIAWEMLFRKDFLHPYLASNAYYDKPLLSYWLMIASSYLLGGMTEWSLRLPSMLSGVATVWCTYWLGKRLVNPRVGILAGWMLVTTYYFIFWARTANADLLNLAGIMLAIVWYFARKDKPVFSTYLVFFCVLAITSLTKGLLGLIVPILAITPDLFATRDWKKHFNIQLFLALIPAAIIYFAPFFLSSHIGNDHYGENGLYEVFRENFVRYFAPYDHKGPIYTYFVYLPIYLLPWAILFIPAVISAFKQRKMLKGGQRWVVLVILIIFTFFTLSGSRRNYYTLPMVPFAILMTACWADTQMVRSATFAKWMLRLIIIFFALLFTMFGIMQPLYYSGGGMRGFAQQVHQQAETIRPWKDWNLVLLDARSKTSFYLQPAHPMQYMPLPEDQRDLSAQELLKRWPMLIHPKPDDILITRLQYLPLLQPYLKDFIIIKTPPRRFLKKVTSDESVALIPLMFQREPLYYCTTF